MSGVDFTKETMAVVYQMGWKGVRLKMENHSGE